MIFEPNFFLRQPDIFKYVIPPLWPSLSQNFTQLAANIGRLPLKNSAKQCFSTPFFDLVSQKKYWKKNPKIWFFSHLYSPKKIISWSHLLGTIFFRLDFVKTASHCFGDVYMYERVIKSRLGQKTFSAILSNWCPGVSKKFRTFPIVYGEFRRGAVGGGDSVLTHRDRRTRTQFASQHKSFSPSRTRTARRTS